MVFGEFAEDVVADELDEVADLAAALRVLVAQRVEYYRAVDVHVFAERVVLQGVAGVDHWRGSVLLLLFGLFPEEGLVVLEVLEGGLDAGVDFVLQHLDHTAVQGQALRAFAVPLPQHLVVGLLLLEPHLHQHPHLLELHLGLLALFAAGHGGEGFVEVGLLLGLVEDLALLLLARSQLLHLPLQLRLVLGLLTLLPALGLAIDVFALAIFICTVLLFHTALFAGLG